MDDRLANYLTALRTASAHRETGRKDDRTRDSGSLRDAVVSRIVTGRAIALIAAHALQMVFTIAAWAFIGAGALNGRVDGAWIVAWGLCLTSAALCRLAAIWLEGTLTIVVAGTIRQALLAGAMAMESDVICRRGHAELLAEVLEAESIERVTESGGFLTLLSIVELAIASVVLAWGAAPGLQIPLLVGWIALAGWSGVRNTALRAAWVSTRIAQTEQLVEHMIAHRTRAVQQSPGAWHNDEDAALTEYLDRSRALDRSTTWLESALPRGYVVAALAAFAPVFVAGDASPVEQAVTLGVILYVGRSLRSLTFGLPRAAAAWIAWRRVRTVAAAAPPAAADGPTPAPPVAAGMALRAEALTFTHQGRHDAAVKDCSLALERGDFALLEGDSGSGKSTFASLLAGSRLPSSGVVLCNGLDVHTIGPRAWRRRIGVVPSYHDNHVLSASFAFNLLIGRPFPHTAEDLAEARQVCAELGLGPLIDRMPSGLDQMVGETGWQLSHGERSRLFLARALLQRPAVLVLDETFAALDAANLAGCVESVFRRAQTAVVIAHP